MPNKNSVLVLQGGGALGAYQAGVFDELTRANKKFNWVVGTSIGAINAAIIAGNPPGKDLESLSGFWDEVKTGDSPSLQFWKNMMPWLPAQQMDNPLLAVFHGVDGFYKPRYGVSLDREVPLSEMGFYDTSPLKETLLKYVDFDYLNSGHLRLSVTAVDIESGKNVVFDNTKQKITLDHIMASGALPPSFPPVEIDGKAYWDGGVYSNSLFDIVMSEAQHKNTRCVLVDLWDPTEERPNSINEAINRFKSIMFASRSHEQLEAFNKMEELRKAIRLLSDVLPEESKELSHVRAAMRLGEVPSINVVQLVMKALPTDTALRDTDFSDFSISARWAAGASDARRALANAHWFAPLPPNSGMVLRELHQQDYTDVGTSVSV